MFTGEERVICAVVVAYRIPTDRIRSWVEYNSPFMKHDLHMFVVVDGKTHDELGGLQHPNMTLLRYPTELEKFNLSKVKNYGIRNCGAADEDYVVSTDIDVRFTDELFAEIENFDIVVPLYYDVTSWVGSERDHPLPFHSGVISMKRKHWAQVRAYDERFVGYGYDDYVPISAARSIGLTESSKNVPVFHVAHQPWNVDFNFRNYENNKELFERSCAEWMNSPVSANWGIV